VWEVERDKIVKRVEIVQGLKKLKELKELKELKGLKGFKEIRQLNKLKKLNVYTCVIPGRTNSPRARIFFPATQPDLMWRLFDCAPWSTPPLPDNAP